MKIYICMYIHKYCVAIWFFMGLNQDFWAVTITYAFLWASYYFDECYYVERSCVCVCSFICIQCQRKTNNCMPFLIFMYVCLTASIILGTCPSHSHVRVCVCVWRSLKKKKKNPGMEVLNHAFPPTRPVLKISHKTPNKLINLRAPSCAEHPKGQLAKIITK